MEKQKYNLKFIGSIFIFAAFTLSMGYAIFKIAYLMLRGYTPSHDVTFFKTYYTIIMQSILGIFCLYIPLLIEKRLHINFPSNLFLLYLAFIFGSIFLGEIMRFYDLISSWDILLHTTSGVMLSAFLYFILENKAPYIKFNYLLFFSFCFAVAGGALWEIFEFSVDVILGTNTQTYALPNGIPFIGQHALVDTMTDLIVDTLGSIFFIIFKLSKNLSSHSK